MNLERETPQFQLHFSIQTFKHTNIMRPLGRVKLLVVSVFLVTVCRAPDAGWAQRAAAGLVVSDSELATSAGFMTLKTAGPMPSTFARRRQRAPEPNNTPGTVNQRGN